MTLIKENFINFMVDIYNMDGQYNIKNTYQQSQQQSQRQEMSIEDAIKIVSSAALGYITKVGVDISPEYRYLKTGDGRYEILRTDQKSFAFHIEIPDSLARAIGNIAKEYIPISGLDKLFSDILRGTNVTVIVGDKPDIYITKRQNQQL